MPTTRSANRVQAHTLVRFDSTRTELTPSANLDAPTNTQSRATKRKVPHPTAESDEEGGSATPGKTKGKRARHGSASPAKSTRASSTRNEAELHGILKEPHFELGRKSPSPRKSDRPTTYIQPPGDVSPVPSSEPSTPGATANGPTSALVPAQLTFSFEEAKTYLIGVDARFRDLFMRMKCRPFENLERVDPFRTLVQSILGQQISWLAARSILYKFIRLYNPDMPETRPADSDWTKHNAFFPTAEQVAGSSIPTLRTAGLSARKAEYVLDLAARFADGRLSTDKLINADDDALAEMLIEVRGIGRWTVDMFAMFSLRRPDILPVGDLGVQRGLLRWFLALHSPAHPFGLEPQKLPKDNEEQDAAVATKSKKAPSTPAKNTRSQSRQATPVPEAPPLNKNDISQAAVEDPQDPDHNKTMNTSEAARMRGSSPDVSSVPPAPVPSTPARRSTRVSLEKDTPAASLGLPALPTPFTASIERTLKGLQDDEGDLPAVGDSSKKATKEKAELPEGLTVAVLKSRLDGKKKIKGAFLTPKEMEELTESWRPYRSLGVYYMWALADVETSKSKSK